MPYRFPVKGEIRLRLDDYGEMDKERLSQRLHYCIRTAQQDWEADNQGINELNRLLAVEHRATTWLEVPVWIRDDFTRSEGEPSHRMAGLLIFDRAGTDISVGIDREVNADNVQPLEPLLRGLLSLLSLALKRAQDHKLIESERRMRQFDQALLEVDDTKQRYQGVLQALCRESEARSGIMVIRGNDPDILDIVATEGESLPAGLTKLRLPLEADYHPIVQAFKTRQQYVCQDFQNGPQIEKLVDGISSSSSNYWQSLDTGEQEKFIEWLRHDIEGLVAMPVMIGTERVGGITLQFDRPWSITRRKEVQINAVLQRARWVMQQALHEKQQSYWQLTLSHDLKSDLYTMEQYLYIMERDHTELSASPRWRQIKRYLLDSTDLADNWLDMVRQGKVETDPPFAPRSAIQYYVTLNEQRIEDDRLKLIWDPNLDAPAWAPLLSGNSAIFARVVRTLIGNAFKFGRAAVPGEGGAEITLASSTKNGHWLFEIHNPGQMTPEEYELRFIAGEIPRKTKADGAHVGLSVAYRWVRIFDGTLTVENEQDNRVRTCLSWPIAHPQQKEEPDGRITG